MSPEGLSQKWLASLAFLLVLPPWLCLAIRTKASLEFVTGHKIPFSKCAIWLIKLLALRGRWTRQCCHPMWVFLLPALSYCLHSLTPSKI